MANGVAMVEVLTGLAEGDRVLAVSAGLVPDGVQLVMPAAAASAAASSPAPTPTPTPAPAPAPAVTMPATRPAASR